MKSDDLHNFSQGVNSLDTFPVWAVKEEKLRPSTEGFRDIGRFGDNTCTNNSDSSLQKKSSFDSLEN